VIFAVFLAALLAYGLVGLRRQVHQPRPILDRERVGGHYAGRASSLADIAPPPRGPAVGYRPTLQVRPAIYDQEVEQ
jgi:hypothetical protein